MAEIKIYNVEALGKPLGQYSHVTRVRTARSPFSVFVMIKSDPSTLMPM